VWDKDESSCYQEKKAKDQTRQNVQRANSEKKSKKYEGTSRQRCHSWGKGHGEGDVGFFMTVWEKIKD